MPTFTGRFGAMHIMQGDEWVKIATITPEPVVESTEQALLAAIEAAPFDDAPRLIYADYLEENSRNEEANELRCEVAARKEPFVEALFRRCELKDGNPVAVTCDYRSWEVAGNDLLRVFKCIKTVILKDAPAIRQRGEMWCIPGRSAQRSPRAAYDDWRSQWPTVRIEQMHSMSH